MEELKMTPQQKAGRTMREKRERRAREFEQSKREQELMRATLTAILEAEDATPADKVRAADLLMQINKGGR